jgi:hypothetical protein
MGASDPITPYTNNGQSGTLINPYLPTSQAAFVFWRKPVFTANDGTLWCPGFEGPTYASSPWDFVYLGIPSTSPFTPGICRVDFEKARDIDKKKAAGNDGARVTIHGADLAAINIELRIWTPEQLKALANLWPVLFPPAYKGAPPAYDVQHPSFAIHAIKSAQFIGGSGPYVDPSGMATFRMRAIEFQKPSKKNVTKTAVGSIGSLLDPGAYNMPSNNTSNLGPL